MQKNNPAFKHSIKLLSIRDYSKKALLKKLVERDFSTDDIFEAINLLIEKNFIREDLYIEARIKGIGRKGYSCQYIQSRLREEELDVSLETIQNTLVEASIEPDEEIERLIRKKIRSITKISDPYKRRFKIESFLRTKGHRPENYRLILSKVIAENE